MFCYEFFKQLFHMRYCSLNESENGWGFPWGQFSWITMMRKMGLILLFLLEIVSLLGFLHFISVFITLWYILWQNNFKSLFNNNIFWEGDSRNFNMHTWFSTWNYLCINVKYFIIIVQHIMAWMMFFLSVLFGNSGGKWIDECT